MFTINGKLRLKMFGCVVSRRAAVRGLSGAAIAAALAVGLPGRAGAGDRIANAPFAPPAQGDDPAAMIEAYVAAVTAGDLEAILSLYADDAVHIALPTPDGSAGVCRGKAQYRMWYELHLAEGYGVAVEDGTLAVDGNQAAFAARVSRDPWRALGLESLAAQAEIVVVGGRIMTHVELLTPESVRNLLSARGTGADDAAQVVVPHGMHGPW